VKYEDGFVGSHWRFGGEVWMFGELGGRGWEENGGW
jgi:hypothetical protein